MTPGAAPRWAAGVAVPEYLRLREGRRPIVVVAPHGGRRRRDIRRGDAVNDLHTADIAWELAERLDAHAIVNHGLDRNDADLNRISHLATRAPEVLALLAASVRAAEFQGAGGTTDLRAPQLAGLAETPLVLFVHGWNMVVPCCDLGLGLRRRAGQLTGRFPTLSRRCFEQTIARIEQELEARGLGSAIGRRYTASGRDNAAQLFSGRHADHENALVAELARLSNEGRVDAAQLELGISLRWPGAAREHLLDAMVAALSTPLSAGGVRRWEGLEAAEPIQTDDDLEPAYALAAVLDADRGVAMFCGVEATGSDTMTARFSLVNSDGTMMLLVGEGQWEGQTGHYDLEGLSWRATHENQRIDIRLDAQMIRYPTHDAYLDLESGLAGSQLVDVDVQLAFETRGEIHGETYGRLRGHVRAGDVALEVDTLAFGTRGGRRSGAPTARLRVLSARADGGITVCKSMPSSDAHLSVDFEAAKLGMVHAQAQSTGAFTLREAEILARVPVWRPLGQDRFARWTFGIVRCRYHDAQADSMGTFESLELFGPQA